jgi:hypothetical protein
MDMAGKTVLVTGSSRGLGRETALILGRKNTDVILVARTREQLSRVRQEIAQHTDKQPLTLVCDISNEADVLKMAENLKGQVSRIDVLVNNAGFGTYRPMEKMSSQEMRRHFEVNLFGVYYCTKVLLPLLKKSSSAYILNIGSFFCRVAGADNSVYAATKFALAGFSQGLRRELKPFGIGVGLFMPGPIKTSFHQNRDEQALRSPDFLMLDPKKTALKVVGMIAGKKKTLIYPLWMYQVLRLKLLLSL